VVPLLLGGAILLDAAMVAAATFTIDPAASELRFHATSRLQSADGRFHRFGGQVTVEPDDLTTARLTVTIDMASIDTASRRRDDHLRSEDFFAVGRFPRAVFQSERVEASGASATVVGRLTIRGVTRPVAVPVHVELDDDAVLARGEFEIRRMDYGVSYQSRLNPVGDVVRVVFTFIGRRNAG
jgi:polyisoprenoid-binding protein YceI